jgi:hypothetical protein
MSEAKETATVAPLTLGFRGEEPFVVDTNMVVTGRTCVIGASGSGKSYAVAVICEELCKMKVPFAIIDTEGEYSGLKERYEAIWVGEGDRCDLNWNGLNPEDLGTQAPDVAPFIIDVSETANPKSKVGAFLTSLYREVSNRREPYLVILEEADKFVPQHGERLQIFEEIARRGRKRGLGLVVCSQRPSLVDKNILSQCSNQLVGRLLIQNDLRSVSQFFPGRGLPKQLTALKPGTFFALGGFSPEPASVTIKKRETTHGGVTPVLRERVVKPFMGALAELKLSALPSNTPTFRKLEARTGGTSPLGLPPRIKADDIPLFVRRQKTLVFFGKEETATSVQLHYRPLIEVGVRLRKGLIKKKFETRFCMLDGETGRFANLGEKLSFTQGLERLLGLTVLQVEVLRAIKPDNDSSVIDVASRLGESRGVVRRAINVLEKKRLVRPIEMRRSKLVRRLIDIPPPPRVERERGFGAVDIKGAKVRDAKVSEQEIRQAVRGLWDGADLDSFKPFLYPLYRVELTLRRRRREVWLDGRSGHELSPS